MAFEFLPPDVSYDILLRLDFNSLCVCRCVSKSLNILISNPSFTLALEQKFKGKIHLLYFCHGRNQVTKTRGPLNDISLEEIIQRDENNSPLLLESGLNGYNDVKVSFRNQPLMRSLGPLNQKGRLMLHESPFFFFNFKQLKFLASCRGLIFLVDGGGETYFMKPVSHKMYKLLNELSLESDASYGFGYSNSMMEYKVVRFCPYGCDVLEIKEFHLRRSNFDSNSGWKSLYEYTTLPRVQGNGVFAAGNLFWMIAKSDDGLIMEFNVDNNEISFVGYPSFDHPKSFSINLGLMDVNGELGMFRVYDKNNSNPWVFDIWMLKERKGAVWVKDYSINLDGCRPKVTPLYFGGGEDIIILQDCDKIYMQNKREEKLRKLEIMFSGHCCAYWENLAAL